MRNLASIQEITDIRPIEGRDRIVLATVLGWHVIVTKDFNVGDRVVFCEIDSVLPEKPEFEFLRPKKFRIRTMKLSNVTSQGICFPLSILPDRGKPYELDEDVTDLIGIKQYEPTMDKEEELKGDGQKSAKRYPAFLMRFKWFRSLVLPKKAKGGWPAFISKTDEIRIQNIPWICEDKREWTATEKVDGCLIGHTSIKTDRGDIFINQIVNNQMKVNVLTYNEELNICEYKPIIDWHKIPNTRPHYKIGIAFKGHGNRPKFIECTDNHKFLTQDGWKTADQLKCSDVLMHQTKVYPSELDEILIGCILGDSSLNSNSETGGYRTINFSHGDKQVDYFGYKKKLFGNLFIEQANHISGYGSLIHTGCLTANLQTYNFIMRYFDKTGKKHVSEMLANDITPISLAFWFMDDGSLSNRDDENLRCRAMLNTQRYSLEENQILAEALKRKFGIDAKIGDKETYKGHALILDVENTAKLCSLIAPYVCKSMKYKIPKKYEDMPCVFENVSFDCDEGIAKTEIMSIECVGQTADQYVYDLEVADNHNYFAKNVLVHNCSGTFALVRHKGLFRDKFEYIVCSRNLRLMHPDSSSYWKVSEKYQIENALKNMIGDREWIALQGECVGPKIQKNKYGLTDYDLYIFNLLYPTGRVDSIRAKSICENKGFNFVPIIEDHVILPDTVDEVLAYADGKSQLADTLREGIVFRSRDGKQSFKAVSNQFLLKWAE